MECFDEKIMAFWLGAESYSHYPAFTIDTSDEKLLKVLIKIQSSWLDDL